jgi:hypothetical protein
MVHEPVARTVPSDAGSLSRAEPHGFGRATAAEEKRGLLARRIGVEFVCRRYQAAPA